MEKYGVRSARSSSFSDHAAALQYATEHFRYCHTPTPLVIKADGLAGGKGVIIAQDFSKAEAAITALMKNVLLGEAGRTLVLEDFIPGKEVSVLAAVSLAKGRPGIIRPFVAARDHKRRFEGGQGPNTGGMGTIAPVPDFSALAQEDFLHAILEPTLKGLEQEGLDYQGFIFFGLMVREDRCFLLEYNVRLGDPETQAVVPLMDFDLAELCLSILDGTLGAFPLHWKAGAVCAPVAVSSGYPSDYQKGELITVNRERFSQTGARLFVAGAETKDSFPGLYTSGGRVLTVSAWGINGDDAWERAYKALEAVSFESMSYRKDIGRE
jgi:phosphoribosylamine--glycine ligase